MRTLYLIACTKTKAPLRAPARALYTSTWFKLARDYVEATGQPWGVLSAKHGFLQPHQLVEPYNDTMNSKSERERAAWAARVLEQIGRCHTATSIDRYVILAGRAYYGHLAPALKATLPLQHLRQGQQMAWFKRQRQIAGGARGSSTGSH